MILLSQNTCDYLRYLCEITIDSRERANYEVDTEEAFRKHFLLLEDCYVNLVNPASVTAHFHYCVFVYEILDEKIPAIKLLRKKHQDIINNLDTIYKSYKNDYYILQRIEDTIALWITDSNYLEEEYNKI